MIRRLFNRWLGNGVWFDDNWFALAQVVFWVVWLIAIVAAVTDESKCP